MYKNGKEYLGQKFDRDEPAAALSSTGWEYLNLNYVLTLVFVVTRITKCIH